MASKDAKKDSGWSEAEAAFNRTKGKWTDTPTANPTKAFNDAVDAYQGKQLGSEGGELKKSPHCY